MPTNYKVTKSPGGTMYSPVMPKGGWPKPNSKSGEADAGSMVDYGKSLRSNFPSRKKFNAKAYKKQLKKTFPLKGRTKKK